MKSSPRQQHLLFLFVLMITGIIFLLRIRNLFPLYTNTQTRNAVKTAMTTVADREGWLLSDMLATNVTADEIRLTHRQHLRGTDPETCVTITLTDSSIHSCD